jgi:outer membrane protein
MRSSLLRVFAVLAVLSVAPQGARAEPRVIDLTTAVRTAVEGHPTLISFREVEKAQREKLEEQRAGYLPSIAPSFAYTRRTANCINQPAGFPCSQVPTTTSGWDTFNFFSTGISINQTIYDFGRTGGAFDVAKVGVEVTRQQTLGTRLGVVLDVKVAYFGVLSNQELVKVAEDALEQQKKHLEQARGFYEVGQRTKIDVAQSESDFATAELNLIRARNNLLTAKLTLLNAMGEPSTALDFTVRKDETPPLPEESGGPDELARKAVEQRADLQALESQARQQETSIRVAKAGYYPQLTMQLGPNWAGTELSNLSTNFLITFTLSWPLGGLNPYFTYHQVDEFHANARAAWANAAKLRNDVRVEVEGARLTLSAAKQAVDAAERALVAARERHVLAEGRYQAGTGSIIELSDAQAALTAARATRVQADFDVSVARARLVKALGRE